MAILSIEPIRFLKLNKMISIVYNVYIITTTKKKSIKLISITSFFRTLKALLNVPHPIFTKFLHRRKSNSLFTQKCLQCREIDRFAFAFRFSALSSNSLNEKSSHRHPSRRPLIAPKLRVINTNERLSSSDSGGSLPKHLTQKPTTTNASRNGYATWNRFG